MASHLRWSWMAMIALALALFAPTILLAPGKYRLALEKLARSLRRGDRVPITLIVHEGAGTIQEIDVDAEVRHRSPTADHTHHHARQ